jgi:hypothetical protein
MKATGGRRRRLCGFPALYQVPPENSIAALLSKVNEIQTAHRLKGQCDEIFNKPSSFGPLTISLAQFGNLANICEDQATPVTPVANDRPLEANLPSVSMTPVVKSFPRLTLSTVTSAVNLLPVSMTLQ